MGAFICDADHISFLAEYAIRNNLSPLTRCGDLDKTDHEAVASLLFEENAKSVSYRYRGEEQAPFEGYDSTGAFRRMHATPVQTIKSAKCFAHQACEHPEWEDSKAHALIEAIIDHAINDLPGYDDASWGAPL